MAHLRYMGTKRGLAPIVAQIISRLPQGPCLDLFAGMCSVAGEMARSGRTVWCNDVQRYAAVVAEALVNTAEGPLPAKHALEMLQPHFAQNMQLLRGRWEDELALEEDALKSKKTTAFVDLHRQWKHIGNDASMRDEARRLRLHPRKPYRLATLTFAHGYFGLKQANQLDSIRYSIDRAFSTGALGAEHAKWCLVALLQVANRLVTSTGHFAQYLAPRNKQTFSPISAIRRRCAWTAFFNELEALEPYGTQRWRASNRVFCDEAVRLSHALQSVYDRPRVVYADPPYSEAQYSRYYHVLESLIAYDYPDAVGKGRYRSDRFNTAFCRPPAVHQAFCDLFESIAATGATLVLSYPSNGLLIQRGSDLCALLTRYFRDITIAYRVAQQHSTLGSWPGAAKKPTSEMIIVATKPRL